MPEIEVDTDRAAAYIERIGQEAAANAQRFEKKTEQLQTEISDSDSDPESWKSASDWVVSFLDKKVCPAWEIDAGEKDMLSASLAEVLDKYFPGALTGFDNWHPLAKLAGSMLMIASMRIDFDTGTFTPMHTPKKESHVETEPRRRTLDFSDGDDEERQDHKRFTTHGE